MLEIDITWMVQELNMKRATAVTVCLLFMLILSIPCALSFGLLADYKIFGKTAFDLADFFVSNLGLPIGGIIACLLAAWFDGTRFIPIGRLFRTIRAGKKCSESASAFCAQLLSWQSLSPD